MHIQCGLLMIDDFEHSKCEFTLVEFTLVVTLFSDREKSVQVIPNHRSLEELERLSLMNRY